MNFSSTPAWSLLPRRPPPRDTHTPGPGSYSPTLPSAAPSYGLGAKDSPRPSSAHSPGPGTYVLPSEQGRGPKYSFGGRPNTYELGDTLPAPGDYQAPSSFSKAGFTMGRRLETKDGKRSGEPGPGAYYRPYDYRSASPAFRMAKGPRDGEKPGDQSPGPGAYYADKKPSGASYSIQGKRHESRGSNEIPGPGQYDISGFAAVRARPQTAILRSPIIPQHFKSRSDAPGPGEYQPHPPPSGPKWGFGQAPRLKTNLSDTPAPGAYYLPSYIRAAGFTLGKRLAAPATSDSTPGPGAYTPTNRPVSPSFRMGPSSRATRSLHPSSPGPGAYYTPLRSATPAFTMHGAKGSEAGIGKDSPGPAAYSIPSTIGRSSPTFTMSGRANRRHGAGEAPGPGHYSPGASRSVSPSYAFPREPRTPQEPRAKDTTVGPGTYFRPLSPARPRWIFGSEARGKGRKNDAPGPGHYDFKPSVPDPALYPGPAR